MRLSALFYNCLPGVAKEKNWTGMFRSVALKLNIFNERFRKRLIIWLGFASLLCIIASKGQYQQEVNK